MRWRKPTHTDTLEERQWEFTLTDILTLLLTFFIFIIAVSTFKTGEYKKFWQKFEQGILRFGKGEKQPAPKSLKFALIKSLKLPWLGPDAETLLTRLEEAFTISDFQGMDVNYDEHKISLAISEQLGFEPGQYRLQEKVKPLLLKFIPILQASPFNVGIEGHTDAQSIGQFDNMELSLNRALVVARFLIQNGLDKHKVSVSGYGPYRPLADNKRPEERYKNRRVEINIIINNN